MSSDARDPSQPDSTAAPAASETTPPGPDARAGTDSGATHSPLGDVGHRRRSHRRRRSWWQRLLPEPRKVRFVWGTPREIPGRWRFRLYCPYRRHSSTRDGLAISLRGLLAYGMVVGVAAFFGVAWLVAGSLDRTPHNFITYQDIVAPWRWERLGELRGRQLLEQGLEEAQGAMTPEVAAKLHRGLELQPPDRRARLVLARYHLERRERASAMEMLTGANALPGFAGRDYVEAFVEFALEADEGELVLVVLDDALAQPAESTGATRRWLAQTKLRILLRIDRAAEALRFVETGDLPDRDVAAEYRIMALLELGRARDSLPVIEAWAAAEGPPAKVARARARAARELRDHPGMEAGIKAWRALEPTAPQPFVEHVIGLVMLARRDQAALVLEDYLFRFGAERDKLLLMATPLSERSELALVERVGTHAREQGLWDPTFEILAVSVALREGDWSRVERGLETIEPHLVRGERRINEWYYLMRGLVGAAASSSETAAQALIDYCRNHPPPLEAYRSVLPALVKAGRTTLARKILEVALGDYPASRFLAQRLAEFEGKPS